MADRQPTYLLRSQDGEKNRQICYQQNPQLNLINYLFKYVKINEQQFLYGFYFVKCSIITI